MNNTQQCKFIYEESCFFGVCTGAYECKCREGAGNGTACHVPRHCWDTECFENCPPWSPWSDCAMGVQERSRQCKCGYSNPNSMIQQDSLCTEWTTCRRPVTPSITTTASNNENALVTPFAVAGSCLLLVILLLAAFFASRKCRGTAQSASRTRTVEPCGP